MLSFLFGSVHGERAQGVAAFLEALPRLCRGAFADCDVGSHRSEICACVVRFRGAPSKSVVSRLAFWAWRMGGSMSACDDSATGMRAGPDPVLRVCDAVLSNVRPAELQSAVRSLLEGLTGLAHDCERQPLSFLVDLGSPDSAGVRFERSRGALIVPSPHSPPIGDDVVIRLRFPNRYQVWTSSTVTAIRAAGEDGPGTPGGLVLGLVDPDHRAVEMLDAYAGSGTTPNQRRAPRYPACARARVSLRQPRELCKGESGVIARLSYAGWATFAEDYLENLSQSGAFIRTTQRMHPGTPVRIDLELPDGSAVTAPGSVVFSNERGVGVHFELEKAGEAAISEAVLKVADRRPRALVVDDDILVRRLVSDSLLGRGFEVFTAADGAAGLQMLIDELLGLELLVTDICMPALGGKELIQLIRGPGGERDLAIVVLSGNLDEGLERRLREAGADAVLSKGAGTAAIADAAARAVLRRRLDGPAPRAHPVLAPATCG